MRPTFSRSLPPACTKGAAASAPARAPVLLRKSRRDVDDMAGFLSVGAGRWRMRVASGEAPSLLRQGELFLVIAFQIFRAGHVALVDRTVIVTKRLAQGECGRAGQGAAGDRADEG